MAQVPKYQTPGSGRHRLPQPHAARATADSGALSPPISGPSTPSTDRTNSSRSCPSTSVNTARRAGQVVVRRRRQSWHDNLPDYRWPHARRRRDELQTSRTTALLRQRPHRRRMRRRNRPARDGPRMRHDHAEHLRPPMAQRRGQDPSRSIRHGTGGALDSAETVADFEAPAGQDLSSRPNPVPALLPDLETVRTTAARPNAAAALTANLALRESESHLLP